MCVLSLTPLLPVRSLAGHHRSGASHHGYFVDHNSGVTMHSLCFMGAGPKPLAKPIELPTPVPASVVGGRLAA